MAETAKVASNPGTFVVSPKLKTICFALMFVGLATFVVMLTRDKDRAWHAYLAGYFYVFVLAIGGLFFTSIQHLTKAGWSVNVRRFCEAFSSYLPVAAVGSIGVILGSHSLYEWFDAAKVNSDHLLAHKVGYLNPTFFVIRIVVFFALWLFFAH